MERTYYDVLQVARDASPEVIAAAFRAQMLALRKHPDLGGSTAEAQRINEAYEALSDPLLRRNYDAALKAREKTAATPERETGEDRRRAPRFAIDSTISYCLNHDTRWHSARITDYSELGVRLRSHQPFVQGEQVVIVPPNLASFAIHGTIRWARVFHPTIFEKVYEAGIEFADQITDIRQRLSI